MSYYFSKIVTGDWQKIKENVIAKLKEQGFGVLTEIDMKTTLKNKIGVDIMRYEILGACNPPFAYQAVTAEENIGLMLPCNVVLKEVGDDQVEVSAVDPIASMQAVKNDSLGEVAQQVQDKLKQFIETL